MNPAVLIASIYVFALAAFLGYQVISRVPPLLHTPLMSATNAISGISLIGSLVLAGSAHYPLFAHILYFDVDITVVLIELSNTVQVLFEPRFVQASGLVEKGNERDAFQVLANGGVFAGGALVATATGGPAWAAAALGALAAATADTWATEVGTVAGGSPRSVISFKPLPAGTSGGVTVSGTLASIVGAACIAGVSYFMGVNRALAAVFVGGVVGSLTDSLLGATIQERRWCDACSEATERRTHYCGRATRVVGGVPGARNDVVNVVCTLVGAGVAAIIAGQ